MSLSNRDAKPAYTTIGAKTGIMDANRVFQQTVNICMAAVLLPAASVFCSGAETPGASAPPGAAQEPGGVSAAPVSGDKVLLPMTTAFISGAEGQKKSALASEPAAASFFPVVMPDGDPALPQGHCCCLVPRTPTPSNPMPYYLGCLDIVSPECATMKVKVGDKPVYEQFAFCPALSRCWARRAGYAWKKLGLAKELSAARDDAIACCPGTGPGQSGQKASGCDEKCLETWEKKIRALSREFEGMDKKARAELDKCVAAAKSPKRDSDGRKIPGEP